MTVLIFANGDLDEETPVGSYLEEATTVIAANGGAGHLLRMGERPDVVIGDLDSFPEQVRESWSAAGTKFLVHPPDKDETDLELALLYAAEQYDESLVIFGGLGGRVDQMLANILLLIHPDLRNRAVRFVTRYQQLWLSAGEIVIQGRTGDTVSLIPVGGAVKVVQTTGLRWPLNDDTLSFGPARGLSNVMTDDKATVTVKDGHLLCVHTSQTWGR